MQQITNLFGKQYKKADTNEGHKVASDLIIATAKLIQEPVGKMFSLTRGWSVSKLDRFYRDASKNDEPRIAWYKMRKYDKR